MFLIVAHHYVVNSGLTASGGVIYSAPLCWKSLFLLLFGAWGKTGINCFVLISGYFMCRSQIKARKLVKLLFEIQFYKLVFYFIFLFSGYASFSITGLIRVLLPITSVSSDFTGCYFLFYLCKPFLNILVQHMNEKQHGTLLLLVAFIYIFFGTVPKLNVSMNYVSWFCVLYFIGSYIRIYPKKIYDYTKLWGMLALFFAALSALSVVFSAGLGSKIDRDMAFYLVTDSNTFLAVANGICSFMFFKNLRVKQSRLVNTVAASTFGVLCIHANSDTMRQWLWKDTLNNVGAYGSDLLVLHAFGSVAAIFIICVLIDIARIRFIERPFFKLWDQHFDSLYAKCNAIANRGIWKV